MRGSTAYSAIESRRLAHCQAAAIAATPIGFVDSQNSPAKALAVQAETSLKAATWPPMGAHQYDHCGDPAFVTIVMHQGGERVWRKGESTPAETGTLGMLPFESSSYFFKGKTTVSHIYVPFALVGAVSESLFEAPLSHEQLWIPMGAKDDRLRCIFASVLAIHRDSPAPHLLLDSWALIVSEALLRRFSSYAGRCARKSFGKIPARRVAHVIDYVEASIDRDLDLADLASVAAMSVYHFARRFKETVGVGPHAYVLSRRIRRAQDMLDRGGNNLAHVAAACGFSSQAHFTTAFQRGLGMTPGEYRRSVSGSVTAP